jgi:hypothetical protein
VFPTFVNNITLLDIIASEGNYEQFNKFIYFLKINKIYISNLYIFELVGNNKSLYQLLINFYSKGNFSKNNYNKEFL